MRSHKSSENNSNNEESSGGNDDVPTNFDWDEYLLETGSIAAPEYCFFQTSDIPENKFEPDMKLEAHDPRCASNTCVATVISKSGPRLRLRLDGSDSCNDFWRLVDSQDIHPIGYAQSKGTLLLPPIGYKEDVSKFSNFVRKLLIKGIQAPPDYFKPIDTKNHPMENKFEVDMKLEAVDQKNPYLIAPATVIGIAEDQILIRFDGYSSNFDFWCRYDSRDLFPCGWCSRAGIVLLEPPSVKKRESIKLPAAEYSPSARVVRAMVNVAVIPDLLNESQRSYSTRSSIGSDEDGDGSLVIDMEGVDQAAGINRAALNGLMQQSATGNHDKPESADEEEVGSGDEDNDDDDVIDHRRRRLDERIAASSSSDDSSAAAAAKIKEDGMPMMKSIFDEFALKKTANNKMQLSPITPPLVSGPGPSLANMGYFENGVVQQQATYSTTSQSHNLANDVMDAQMFLQNASISSSQQSNTAICSTSVSGSSVASSPRTYFPRTTLGRPLTSSPKTRGVSNRGRRGSRKNGGAGPQNMGNRADGLGHSSSPSKRGGGRKRKSEMGDIAYSGRIDNVGSSISTLSPAKKINAERCSMATCRAPFMTDGGGLYPSLLVPTAAMQQRSPIVGGGGVAHQSSNVPTATVAALPQVTLKHMPTTTTASGSSAAVATAAAVITSGITGNAVGGESLAVSDGVGTSANPAATSSPRSSKPDIVINVPAQNEQALLTIHINPHCAGGSLLNTSKLALLPLQIGPCTLNHALRECIQQLLNCALCTRSVMKALPAGEGQLLVTGDIDGKTTGRHLPFMGSSEMAWHYLRQTLRRLGTCPNMLCQARQPCPRCPHAAPAAGGAGVAANRGGMLAVHCDANHIRNACLAVSAPPRNDRLFSSREQVATSSSPGFPTAASASSPSVPSTSSIGGPEVLQWSVDEVYAFLSGCDDLSIALQAEAFRKEKICGKALLLLNAELMIRYMSMKIGPALKIEQLIAKLRSTGNGGATGGYGGNGGGGPASGSASGRGRV